MREGGWRWGKGGKRRAERGRKGEERRGKERRGKETKRSERKNEANVLPNGVSISIMTALFPFGRSVRHMDTDTRKPSRC